MSRSEEPFPRERPLRWKPFVPATSATELLVPPGPGPATPFGDVLESRRSAMAGDVDWPSVAGLLWHAAATKGWPGPGRAGLPLQERPAPSAGGLHPVRIVCMSDRGMDAPRLYDPETHSFHLLHVVRDATMAVNRAAVETVTGASRGTTLRMVADMARTRAGYHRPESLVMRDAGCLIATLCLCAGWLGLAACPLGFLGQEMVSMLGFPTPRFRAVGAVQITG